MIAPAAASTGGLDASLLSRQSGGYSRCSMELAPSTPFLPTIMALVIGAIAGDRGDAQRAEDDDALACSGAVSGGCRRRVVALASGQCRGVLTNGRCGITCETIAALVAAAALTMALMRG